jgi:hypothetical protein
MGRDVFVPRGMTNVKPCGKSRLGWQDFAAGVASTKAHRPRVGGGANSANPSERSVRRTIHFGDNQNTNAAGMAGGSRRCSHGHNTRSCKSC